MNNLTLRLITGIILLSSFLLIFFYFSPIVFSTILIAELIYILLIEWPPLCKPDYLWLITPLYPIAPFLALIYLNHHHHQLLFTLILLIATFDSASYIFGKLWGKHKIAPHISPGKTWEGFLGGSVVTIIVGSLFLRVLLSSLALALLFSFAIAASSLVGDLFESYLKRRVGQKDSGLILPGHGGLLDRMDGLMFAGVVVLFLVMV